MTDLCYLVKYRYMAFASHISNKVERLNPFHSFSIMFFRDDCQDLRKFDKNRSLDKGRSVSPKKSRQLHVLFLAQTPLVG